MENYVEVAYNLKEKPIGEYPLQLAEYFCNRFSLKPGMRLLDNGCGRGDFLQAFKKCGLETYGCDVSDYCDDVNVCNLETDRLPFDDGYFDVVFSKSVIEHLYKSDNYLSEMRRVLREGGELILMTPDWGTQYKIFYQDPTHVHPYTVKSIERLLDMWGFKEVMVERFVQLPETWGGGIFRIISSVIRFMGPVKKVHKLKFYRFSRELMILGAGRKI